MSLSEPQRYVEAWQQSIDRYHDRVRQNPYDVQILTNLAWSYERAGEYPQAIQQFKQALSLDQNSTDAQYGLGLALLGNDQHQEALQALERAHSLAVESDNRGYMVIVQHHCEVLFRRYRSA